MKSTITRILLTTFVTGLFVSSRMSGAILYSDPLPTRNLNEAAGSLRSNIAVTESDPTDFFTGDTFVLPAGNSAYVINSFTTWSVASILGQALGQEFSSVSFYLRPMGGSFQTIATGTPGTTFTGIQNDTVLDSNPNITHKQVGYDFQDPNYEGVGTPGVFYPLWQTTFTNLDLVLLPGVTYEFGVWGVGVSPDPNTLYGYWFNHLTNAALSGRNFSGSDGFYSVFDFADPTDPGFQRNLQQAGLWDKGADMNIVIAGLGIPEPATVGLMGAGLGALIIFSRRRAQRA